MSLQLERLEQVRQKKNPKPKMMTENSFLKQPFVLEFWVILVPFLFLHRTQEEKPLLCRFEKNQFWIINPADIYQEIKTTNTLIINTKPHTRTSNPYLSQSTNQTLSNPLQEPLFRSRFKDPFPKLSSSIKKKTSTKHINPQKTPR